jgi:hypothetical protein
MSTKDKSKNHTKHEEKHKPHNKTPIGENLRASTEFGLTTERINGRLSMSDIGLSPDSISRTKSDADTIPSLHDPTDIQLDGIYQEEPSDDEDEADIKHIGEIVLKNMPPIKNKTTKALIGYNSAKVADWVRKSSTQYEVVDDSVVTIGHNPHKEDAEKNTISIGTDAGKVKQHQSAIALGAHSGEVNQHHHAIAIGTNAGKHAQGAHTIAMGHNAGLENQPDNSIIFNASEDAFNANTQGLFIKPIRTASQGNPLFYNSDKKELTYYTSSQVDKSDIIDLPIGKSESLYQLAPRQFTYIPDNTPNVGFIAEEVSAIDPSLVIYGDQGQPVNIKWLDLITYIVSQLQRIKTDKADTCSLESLRVLIDALQSSLDKLQTTVSISSLFLESTSSSVKSLQTTIDSHTTSIGELQTAVQSGTASIGDMQTAVQSGTASIGDMQVALSNQQSATQTTIDNQQSTIGHMLTSLERLQSMVDSSTTKSGLIHTSVRTHSVDIGELQDTVSNLQNTLNAENQRTQLANYKSTLDSLKDYIIREINDQKLKLANHDIQIGKLSIPQPVAAPKPTVDKTSIDKLQNQIDHITNMHNNLKQHLERQILDIKSAGPPTVKATANPPVQKKKTLIQKPVDQSSKPLFIRMNKMHMQEKHSSSKGVMKVKK